MPIIRYGYATEFYDFTQAGVYADQLSSNFGQKVNMYSRMPYMDGSFRETGVNVSPKESGSIQMNLTLKSDTRAGMDAKRQALEAILGYGLVPLVYRQTDPTNRLMFTYAEVMNLNGSRRLAEHTDLHQKYSISFEVPDPYWYVSTQGDILGLTFVLGVSTLGGNPVVINAVGTLTEGTATNAGNAPTLAKITIACGVGQTCTNPTIRRIVNGQIVDEVSYANTIASGDTLIINALSRSVTYEGTDAFDTSFDFKHPRFMAIMPGDNTIRVVFANPSDQATVTLTYLDAYYGS